MKEKFIFGDKEGADKGSHYSPVKSKTHLVAPSRRPQTCSNPASSFPSAGITSVTVIPYIWLSVHTL